MTTVCHVVTILCVAAGPPPAAAMSTPGHRDDSSVGHGEGMEEEIEGVEKMKEGSNLVRAAHQRTRGKINAAESQSPGFKKKKKKKQTDNSL